MKRMRRRRALLPSLLRRALRLLSQEKTEVGLGLGLGLMSRQPTMQLAGRSVVAGSRRRSSAWRSRKAS